MKIPMTVKFWGVRGSIPSPGPLTCRYGGNTACVSVELGADRTLILDSGTGIRELGKVLAPKETDIYILLTHMHWDHIQGFPFFVPIYQCGRVIYKFPHRVESIFSCLLEQMDGAHFPIRQENLPSRFIYIKESGAVFLREHGFKVSRIPLNHPGGGNGYRIEHRGRSIVYLTDNELEPPLSSKTTDFHEFVRFCKNADLLIHDAQYVEQDMPEKHGWGHSLVSQACEMAAEANVKHLILFHHDPDRTDDELDSIQEGARSWFEENNLGIQCTMAFEGLELNVDEFSSEITTSFQNRNTRQPGMRTAKHRSEGLLVDTEMRWYNYP